MLSIALVLLLILGINYVFKATSDAVGAGQQINTFSRDTQSATPMVFDDFRNIAKNPPCFIIGRAPALSSNPSANDYLYNGPFTGPNQDIAAMSAFIRINTATN